MNDDTDYLLGALGLVLCAYAALQVRKRQRTRRRFKIRPINRGREPSGNFQYYRKMKTWDKEQFFNYTRMTIPVFEKLLSKIMARIHTQYRSDGISPEQRLLITLQFLSQGTSMQALASTFHMGHTTVHKIIHKTCVALWDILSPEYLKTPESEEEWLDISQGFQDLWNFPHCLGSIDGKHINIQAPPKSNPLFVNCKNTFSVVLLASCDYNYKFTAVDIGAHGSRSDGGVFKHSMFGQRMENSEMNIPQEKPLPETNTQIPYFFVADVAFPLKKFIMRPYAGRNLSNRQKIFNYRLSRARQVSENTFGILVTRWRLLKTTINAKMENVDNIIKAIVVLHNYCQTELSNPGHFNIYCPPNFVDTEGEENGGWRAEQEPLQSVGRLGANVTKRFIYAIRDTLSEYFISDEGQVPWQDRALIAPS